MRSESQSTVRELAGGVVDQSGRRLQKKGVGMVWRRGQPFYALPRAPAYPAISVAVVTSFCPSQMVLNCSGTGSSV